MWFTESAISSQYYNETISFTISKTKRKLTHNLVLSSAKETVTEELLFDCTKQLYLVLEIFHGDICSIQMYPPDKAPKQQCKTLIICLSLYDQLIPPPPPHTHTFHIQFSCIIYLLKYTIFCPVRNFCCNHNDRGPLPLKSFAFNKPKWGYDSRSGTHPAI